MFGALLQRRSERKQPAFVMVCGKGDDVGQRRLAARQRSGLVDDEHREIGRTFERADVAHEDAGARAPADADGNGGRRRQAQGAGTGDDEDGNGVDQRLREVAGNKDPADEGDERQRAYHRDEHRRDAVGQLLHGRLRRLRLGDAADDPGEQGMLPDAGRAAAQHPLAVGGRREDPVAGALGERHALAREHRLVDAGGAVDHLAVDRDAVAGTDDEDVARQQQRRVDVDQAAVALDTRGLGLQAQQGLDRFRHAQPGARLEQLAKQHQRDHRGRGLEIDVQRIEPGHGDHRAERPGHGRAERDQHVHVGAAAAQGLPAAGVEAPAGPELHRRRQQQLRPARQPFHRCHLMLPAAKRHQQHRQQQRQGQHGGNAEGMQLGLPGGELARFLLGAGAPGVALGHAADEAGGGNRQRQARRVGEPRHVTDARALAGEVDRGDDTRQTVEHLLQARRTRGAAHALDGELDGLLGNAETRLLDRRQHLLWRRRRCRNAAFGADRRRQLDARALSGQIDRGLDPRQPIEDLLQARRTRGAAHPGDRQVEPAGTAGRWVHRVSSTGQSS